MGMQAAALIHAKGVWSKPFIETMYDKTGKRARERGVLLNPRQTHNLPHLEPCKLFRTVRMAGRKLAEAFCLILNDGEK